MAGIKVRRTASTLEEWVIFVRYVIKISEETGLNSVEDK